MAGISSPSINPQASSTSPDYVSLVPRSSDYYPFYNQMNLGGLPPATDPSGSWVTRGAITTDEGTFRINFTNNTLTQSPGSATFTNGSYIVTGSGFSALDLHYGDFVKLTADAESAWAQISFINSDTQIILFTPYSGSTATGAYVFSELATSTGTGATISVSSGSLTIALGTNTSAQTYVYKVGSDGSALWSTSFSLSQRIANQDIYAGFESQVTGAIRTYTRFHFSGTDNTKVICESAYNPTTSPSSSEMETTTITLPNGATTASAHTYKLEREYDQVTYYIDNNLIATHTKRIPHIYDDSSNVLYVHIRGLNSGSVTATSIVVDYFFVKAFDRIDTVPNQSSAINAQVAYFRVMHYTDSTYDYFCFATPGTSLGASSWLIKRVTADGILDFASGSINFNLAATNLATVQGYTYS